jgi:hypothetical protein
MANPLKRKVSLTPMEIASPERERPLKRRKVSEVPDVQRLKKRLEESQQEREKVRSEFLAIKEQKAVLQNRLFEVLEKEKAYLQALPPIVIRDINYISTGLEPGGETARDFEAISLVEKVLNIDLKFRSLENLEKYAQHLTLETANKDLTESVKARRSKKLKNIMQQKASLERSISKNHLEKIRKRLVRARGSDQEWKERWQRLGSKGLIRERFRKPLQGLSEGAKEALDQIFPELKVFQAQDD